MVAAFTAELSKFPADLVVWSLRKWATINPWWPALAEILGPVKREMGWRNALADAANTNLPIEESSEPKAQTRYGPATQKLFKDTIARIKAEVAANKHRPVVLPDVTVPRPDRSETA